MTPAQQLNQAIRTHLQGYLGTPAEQRTQLLYDRLVDSLLAAGEEHTRAFVAERRASQRQSQVKRR